MALDIDGFAVFERISSHRDTFPIIAADLAKTARTLIVKQMRHKETGLEQIRKIRAALGMETFNLITDGMPDAQIKALTLKFDKHNRELKTSSAAAQRRHFLSLVDGSIAPLEKQKATPKATPPKKERSVPTDRIQFRSAGAKRKR